MAAHDNQPFITLEEHFMLPALVDAATPLALSTIHPGTDYTAIVQYQASKIVTIGAERISDMDKAGISRQVLSHAPIPLPNEPSTATACAANDMVAAACKEHPDRFSAFAWLNMREPSTAAAELRRRVSQQGFLGAFLDDHTPDGRRYDDSFFWEVFEAAQDLDVPVYLHPSFPPAPGAVVPEGAQIATSNVFQGNYPLLSAGFLSSAGLNWHSDTAMHFLRLYAAGLFDRYPKLKLVLGHDGEGLPYFYERLEPSIGRFATDKDGNPWQRSFREVWQENLWFTTSGMPGLSPMACMLRNVPVEHIMLSIDYPFSSCETGRSFMESLKASGLVTDEQWNAIGWRNAQNLLKL